MPVLPPFLSNPSLTTLVQESGLCEVEMNN